MLRLLTGLAVLLVLGSTIGCCSLHRKTPGCVSGACGVDGCGDCCPGPCHHGFLSPLEQLLSCGSGCGEVYWDEWLSDPPDCCDPCDPCGNWIGPQGDCCHCSEPLNHCNGWGQRFAHSCDDVCGTAVADDGVIWEGEGGYDQPLMQEGWSEWIDQPPTPPVPTPADPPARSAAAPARPRNIFQHILGPGQPRVRTARQATH